MSHQFCCGSAAAEPQTSSERWHFLKRSYQVCWPLILLRWAGRTPDPLSHIFHWNPKWYSTPPIASPFSSFFLFFSSMPPLCAVEKFERSRGTARLSQNRRRAGEDSHLARSNTWQTPDFHLGHFSMSARNSATPTAGETTRTEIQECRRSENHFPFDEEIWLLQHAEVISYLAVKDALWSPCSLEPGLCLLLTPALGHKYERLQGLIVRFL